MKREAIRLSTTFDTRNLFIPQSFSYSKLPCFASNLWHQKPLTPQSVYTANLLSLLQHKAFTPTAFWTRRAFS